MADLLELGTTSEGAFSLDLQELLTSGLYLQGNSGSGKSGLIRRILEQSFGLVQQIILDAEGDYSTLRAGFDYAPVSAHVETAESLALKIYEAKVTVIVDMSDLDLPAQQEYVRIFVGAQLLHARRLKPEQRHHALVVLDELQLFAPEQTSAESTSVMVDLGHRGRRLGLHPILATQRLSSVKKDAVSEIPNKLFGRTALDVDQKRVGQEMGFDRTAQRRLADLKAREFWAFGPALSPTPALFMVADVATPMPRIGELASMRLPELTPEVLASLAALEAVEPEAHMEATTKESLAVQPAASVSELRELREANAKLFEELRRSEGARRTIEANAEAWTDQADQLATSIRRVMAMSKEILTGGDGRLQPQKEQIDGERKGSDKGLRRDGGDEAGDNNDGESSGDQVPAEGGLAINGRARSGTPSSPRRVGGVPASGARSIRSAGRDTEDMKDEEVTALVKAEVARQLRDSNRVLVVPPAEVIRKDYLSQAIDRLMVGLKELSPDALEAYRLLLSRDVYMTVGHISQVISGYQGGAAQVKWGSATKALLDAGLVAKGGSGGNGFKGDDAIARSRVVRALEPHVATNQEIEEVYQAVLGRIAGEGVLVG